MFDGQCFFFFPHSKSGTSNVNKAEDAGGTHPLSAGSRVRLFSPEAHCLIYECLPTAEPKPSTVRRRDCGAVSCPWPITHHIGVSSALWRLSDRDKNQQRRRHWEEATVLGAGKRPRRCSFSYLHPNHCIDKEQHHDQKGHIGQGLEGSTQRP